MTGRYTMREWMDVGPRVVGTLAADLEITDREPLAVEDPIGTGYGWQYGWRWLLDADDVEFTPWTLPEAVFRHLPACPYQVRDGVMPRWPTRDEAMGLLRQAALAWAQAAA